MVKYSDALQVEGQVSKRVWQYQHEVGLNEVVADEDCSGCIVAAARKGDEGYMEVIVLQAMEI